MGRRGQRHGPRRSRTRSPRGPRRQPDRRRPRCASASPASDTRARRRRPRARTPCRIRRHCVSARSAERARSPEADASSPAAAVTAGPGGRRPRRPRAAGRARLHDLHHDAERLLGMQERLRPAGIGVVEARRCDSPCATARSHACCSVGTTKVTWWTPGPRAGEEAVQEAVVAERLENLQPAAARRSPSGPTCRRRTARRRRSGDRRGRRPAPPGHRPCAARRSRCDRTESRSSSLLRDRQTVYAIGSAQRARMRRCVRPSSTAGSWSAIAFVTMALAVNARTAFSLLFPPILDEFGWERGVTAGAFSVGFLASTVFTPWMGALHGPARPALGDGRSAASALAAGLALAPLVREPWHLYLTLGVLVAGGTHRVRLHGPRGVPAQLVRAPARPGHRHRVLRRRRGLDRDDAVAAER